MLFSLEIEWTTPGKPFWAELGPWVMGAGLHRRSGRDPGPMWRLYEPWVRVLGLAVCLTVEWRVS